SRRRSTTAPTRSRAARTSGSSSTCRRCASDYSRRRRSAADMRVGLLGGGVIARLFLEHARSGQMGEAKVVAIAGRSENSRGKALANEFGVPFVIGGNKLLAFHPEVVIEAASHDAVREHAEALLSNGIAVIVLSGGALCDEELRARLERAAAKHRALLYLPSGGIGGLDALKAACAAGVDEVSIAVTKPPAAWKGIAYDERMKIDLDRLAGAVTLFEGTAREGQPHFAANVNVAAVLSLAGVGPAQQGSRLVGVVGKQRDA